MVPHGSVPVPVLSSSGVGPDVGEAPWRQQLHVVSLDLGTCEIKRQIACPVTQHIVGKPTSKGRYKRHKQGGAHSSSEVQLGTEGQQVPD